MQHAYRLPTKVFACIAFIIFSVPFGWFGWTFGELAGTIPLKETIMYLTMIQLFLFEMVASILLVIATIPNQPTNLVLKCCKIWRFLNYIWVFVGISTVAMTIGIFIYGASLDIPPNSFLTIILIFPCAALVRSFGITFVDLFMEEIQDSVPTTATANIPSLDQYV